MSFVNKSFQKSFNINFVRNIKGSLKSQFFFFFVLHKKVSKIGLLTNGLATSINIYQKIKRKNFQQTDTFFLIVPKFPRGSIIREISQFFNTC